VIIVCVSAALVAGDFRFQASIHAEAMRSLRRRPIDMCYFDATFCHPSCVGFPLRRVAVDHISTLVKLNKNASRRVYLACDQVP